MTDREDAHHQNQGHAHDRGVSGMLRYLRYARDIWRSDVNAAVIARLAPQAGETVMDIGAGAGAGTVLAAQTGATVLAVEPTPYMRAVLGLRRFVKPWRERVSIVNGSAEATMVPVGSINAAWAVNSMHHWTDFSAAAAELARVLAPGGRVLLVDEDFFDPTHPEHQRFCGRRGADHAHQFEQIDPEVVAGELRRAGLIVGVAGTEWIAGRPSLVIEASVP